MLPASNRACIQDGPWPGGMDSLLHPSLIEPSCYAWGVNLLNRGGLPQTRPGRQKVWSFLGQNAQGCLSYRTYDGTQYLVAVIDGVPWQSRFPFTSFSPIAGIRMKADAPRVYMHAALQASMLVDTPSDGSAPAATNTGIPDTAGALQPTGNGSTQNLVVLPVPINWLIFQDGFSNPAWWNGTTGYQPHLPDGATGLPIATNMVQSGNRLWIAQGNKVLASDLLNPLRFTERTFLAEADNFRFPYQITAFLVAPSDSGIFVFTEQSVHSLQSAILDRTTWQNTPKFQDDISWEVGCVAPFSVVYQHGLPWFYSAKGLLSLDRAMQGFRTSVLYTQDGEMQRSKNRLSPFLDGICIGTFENVLLCSVPSSNRFNRHTWVMDSGTASKLNGSTAPIWSSLWTGTFPVQYANVVSGGVERLYHLAYSAGTVPDSSGRPLGIHLWEDFQQRCVDASITRVESQLETRFLIASSAPEQFVRAAFVELHAVNVKARVDVSVYLAGISGHYQFIGTAVLRSDEGPAGSPLFARFSIGSTAQPNSVLQSFRAQNRYLRTPEVAIDAARNSACVEIGRLDGVDRGFQVLVKWKGRMGIRRLQLYVDVATESPLGACMPDESAKQNVLLEANA
jgi:hypothetical protein